VPQAPTQAAATEKLEKPARKSKYIPWAELLRRTFGFEVVCQKCQSPLRLIALVKNQDTAKKILVAMHLVPAGPRAYPPCPCPTRASRAPVAGLPARAAPGPPASAGSLGGGGRGRLGEPEDWVS
jgi:hypothetical protein